MVEVKSNEISRVLRSCEVTIFDVKIMPTGIKHYLPVVIMISQDGSRVILRLNEWFETCQESKPRVETERTSVKDRNLSSQSLMSS